MTITEKEKIEQIIKYSSENKPASIKPLVNSILSAKIAKLIDQKREELSRKL